MSIQATKRREFQLRSSENTALTLNGLARSSSMEKNGPLAMLASRWSANTSAEPSLGATRHRLSTSLLGKSQNSPVNNRPAQMEPRRPFDPLHPAPTEPIPSPLRPQNQYLPRNDESLRVLKEILDRLTGIEIRLKAIEEQMKTRR